MMDQDIAADEAERLIHVSPWMVSAWTAPTSFHTEKEAPAIEATVQRARGEIGTVG